ncbi:phosphatase PAP2 family protein [Sphingomonas sp. PAMC 26617]|uniref:phosphatase PAP2 family protein n=1 Tax=Sphingomonas sp. PAMC 26617 TaxID=1112216 RepID=UPI000287F894|nr:phosphatase PAP2 family protein [Sphingomonas sp. PAMC 26617]
MFNSVVFPFAPPAPVYPVGRSQTGLIPGRWLAIGFAASLACLVALMTDTGLTIDPRAPSTLVFAGVFTLAASLRYFLRTPRSAAQRVARDIAETFGLFTAISLTGAVATYPIGAETSGTIDPLLQQIDVALHFDWLAWYQVVADHRALQILGTAAYQSIYVSPALILGYCAWADKRAAARGLIASFWVAAVLALVLFSFWPAYGPFATLWHGPAPYQTESGLYESQLLPLLRSHVLREVDLGNLRGLVEAPSFHTASAVLYIAAAWPFARIRKPILLVNLAMLVATPVEGTHYLADMLAGASVAIVAVLLVTMVRRRLPGHA